MPNVGDQNIFAESFGSHIPDVDFVHFIASQMASGDALDQVLERVVAFATAIVNCDSCFVYSLESGSLILRASMNSHQELVGRLKLAVGEGITGWVAEHVQPVAISRGAFQDARFQFFNELPEDQYEAFLSVPVLCRGRVVGVINLQHRMPHHYTEREVRLISTIGFLAGAEIELARLEAERSQLSGQLETRKVVERAKGILQRDLKITEEEAYLALRRKSRQHRRPMKEVAETIVLADVLKRKSSRP